MIFTALLALVPMQFPFTQAGNHKIIVTLKVEGKLTEMVLDTGSTLTIFRKKIGSMGDTTEVRGATGSSFAYKCQVDIASRVIQALCGVNLPDAQEGLLGSDFLNSYSSVVIDYKNRVVKLIP